MKKSKEKEKEKKKAAAAAAASSSSGRKVQSLIRPKKKIRLAKSSTPSPLSSSHLVPVKHDKSVYVRVLNVEDQLEWYTFFFNASDVDEELKRGLRGYSDHVPVPTPMKKKKISQFSSCAAVGSTIYCIGGLKTQTSQYSGRLLDKVGQPTKYHGRLLDKVRYLDTSIIPQPSWAKGPSMLNARSESCTVALKGKIYVMGGTLGEPWAEVFNPESDSWVALPSPSPKPSDSGLFSAALHDFDKVVVGSSEDDFLYLYDVMTKCWERLDKKIGYGPSHVQPVAVGTTLFWFQKSELHAYDLFLKMPYSGPIQGLEKIVFLWLLTIGSVYFPVLLHIAADEFYWICCDSSSDDITLLRCLKFHVSERTVRDGKGYLNAFPETCQSYLIRTPSLLIDAVLMSPQSG